MSDTLILHHFDASPFAEKVRLALGLKKLCWRSVEIPMVMPKPQLTALTGGYRKTPVLQVGADIYCDTQCIALELERRFPRPALFPDDSRGISLALSHWGDTVFFRPGAALAMGTNEGLPDDLLRDRQAFFTFMDFGELPGRLPHYFSQYQAQLQLLEHMLAGDQPYLLGEQPGWADIVAYFAVWMGRGNIARMPELLAPLPGVLAWEQRLLAIGHGEYESMAPQEALEIAAHSRSSAEAYIDPTAWPQDLTVGTAVSVTPEDYGAVPVHGALLRLTPEHIAIQRRTAELGELVVHFPRTGYEIRRE